MSTRCSVMLCLTALVSVIAVATCGSSTQAEHLRRQGDPRARVQAGPADALGGDRGPRGQDPGSSATAAKAAPSPGTRPRISRSRHAHRARPFCAHTLTSAGQPSAALNRRSGQPGGATTSGSESLSVTGHRSRRRDRHRAGLNKLEPWVPPNLCRAAGPGGDRTTSQTINREAATTHQFEATTSSQNHRRRAGGTADPPLRFSAVFWSMSPSVICLAVLWCAQLPPRARLRRAEPRGPPAQPSCNRGCLDEPPWQ